MSLNKGLSDPTHAQMKHLLTRPYPDQVGCPQMMFDPASLKRGERVTFHENINMQAKVVIDEALNKKTPKKVKGRASKLLHYWWDFLELPDFIAAFAKQWNGGSFFLGLKEEKTEQGPRWKPVPNTQGLWGVLETDIQCWADDKNTEDKKIFHLAKAEDVPKFEVRSGHFTCVGVSLTENEKEKLEEQLRGKIRNFLPCRPSGNAASARRDQELVELKFHPVRQADGAGRSQEAGGSGQAPSDSTLYVVEARVNYYHGVCFNNKRGPVAYKFDRKDRPTLAVKLPLDIWLQAQAWAAPWHLAAGSGMSCPLTSGCRLRHELPLDIWLQAQAWADPNPVDPLWLKFTAFLAEFQHNVHGPCVTRSFLTSS